MFQIRSIKSILLNAQIAFVSLFKLNKKIFTFYYHNPTLNFQNTTLPTKTLLSHQNPTSPTKTPLHQPKPHFTHQNPTSST